MKKKAGKILLIVTIYSAVLLLEVESFLKIGREFSRNLRPLQEAVSETTMKQKVQKDNIYLQEKRFQIEPSLKTAQSEQIKILQTMKKKYAVNKNNFRKTFDEKSGQL